ncbi:hypothetical protein ACIRQQ_01435 [Streptomyces fuscichromogenes]|uniref:hypothetical protein n=1 Tax=Streptomyces fuscichromogenes TaxID=1324013 RepID=UPI003821D06D
MQAQTSSLASAPNCTYPAPPSEQHPGPVTPWQTQVALPEEPPDVTEPVAATLLQLLRTLIADSTQQRPETGNG